ncbi:MAG: FkbM family methyltransferase [Terriglobales bacterium]
MSTTDRVLRWLGHRSWLPWRFRIRIVRIFRHPDHTPPTPFEVDFSGMKYRGSLNVLLDQHVYFFGAYMPRELDLLRKLLELRGPGAIFADIGANVGHHSLYLSRFAGHVHSFEPWPVVSQRITEKISLNNIPNIHMHPVGLSDAPASLEFFASTSGNSGTGSFKTELAGGRNQPAGRMNVERGDDYFAQAGITGVDVMKIDVEGWEPKVLAGLKQTIARDRPIIFMEYSATTDRSLAHGVQDLLGVMPDDYVALHAIIGAREYQLLEQPRPGIESELLLLPRADKERLLSAHART